MKADELRALAERVMALTGPDRGVLKKVFAAVHPERVPSPIVASGYGWREDASGWWLATGEDARTPPKAVYPPPYFASLDAAITLLAAKGWHWRKLTGTSVSVYRQDPAKTATARFDGFGYNDACRMTAAYLLALADSMAIAEKAAARAEQS